MLTLTVEHNYICFITRSLQQRHVLALYVGHHQVVVRFSDQTMVPCDIMRSRTHPITPQNHHTHASIV